MVSLVVVANLIGVVTVTLLLIGVDDGNSTGRTAVLLAAVGYLVVALPVGALLGLRRQRVTNAWLIAGRPPSVEEARRALRMPVDTAIIAGLAWLLGARPRRPGLGRGVPRRMDGPAHRAGDAARRHRHRRPHVSPGRARPGR
jgi:hypothetical protein